VGTNHRVVRKAIAQSSKPRRPRTLYAGCFAIYKKCGTSLDVGADPHVPRRFNSNASIQPRAKAQRFFGLHNVVFDNRKFPQTKLRYGNLYGFPTAARGSAQVRLTIEPTGVMLARSRIRWSLPLAREAIPYEADFIPEVTTSVWPGCNLQAFVNYVSS
jgi:hypothetical protein